MSKSRVFTIVLGALILLLAVPAAAEESYTFGQNEARTNVTFVGEAELETIHGFTNKISGEVKTDGEKLLESAIFKVKVADMETGIELRDEHMRGEGWLDASQFPTIQLELTKATQKEGSKWAFEGKLTIKGVSQTVSGEAKIKFVDEEKAARFKLGDGAWVQVKTSIVISLSDFGIEVPDQAGAKVSDSWTLGVDIWGSTGG